MNLPRPTLRNACLALAIASLAGASGCASTGRLGEYDFRDRTLAVIVDTPPRPEVFDSSVPIGDGDASDDLGSVFARVGTSLLRDVSAAEAESRLTAAAERVNLARLIGRRTLERSARVLRMDPVADGPAEFELEVRIDRYGLTSRDWNAQAFFMVEGELLLIDAADGSIVWETGLSRYDPINRGDTGLGESATNVVTAAIFATLTEDQMAAALTALAEHAADHATDRLQDAYDEVRRR